MSRLTYSTGLARGRPLASLWRPGAARLGARRPECCLRAAEGLRGACAPPCPQQRRRRKPPAAPPASPGHDDPLGRPSPPAGGRGGPPLSPTVRSYLREVRRIRARPSHTSRVV